MTHDAVDLLNNKHAAESKQVCLSPDQKSNMLIYDLIGSGLVPELLIRAGIRSMLAYKLHKLGQTNEKTAKELELDFVRELKAMPIAIETKKANEQHYEVPAQFYKLVLGPRLKYSCAYFSDSAKSLEQAELEMLNLSAARAELENGGSILDLGCGWGAFCLYAAERYPDATLVALSNSNSQREHIESQARLKGLRNLQVFTGDISKIPADFFKQRLGASGFNGFDRIVSVEMFEHMKNYQLLLQLISSWLKPSGKLFVHIFTHKEFAYHFQAEAENDWLSRYFFSGGTMPSHDLLSYFQDDLKLKNQWQVSGTHYQKTAEAWLSAMGAQKSALMPLLESTYGAGQAKRWWNYWRLFFIACAELWGFDGGRQWQVSHYLFQKEAL